MQQAVKRERKEWLKEAIETAEAEDETSTNIDIP